MSFNFFTRASGNQVAQSVRAQQASGDCEAMHGFAATLQGQLSAAVALLDLAGGGGAFDATGQVKITADHVEAGLTPSSFSEMSLHTVVSRAGSQPPSGNSAADPDHLSLCH